MNTIFNVIIFVMLSVEFSTALHFEQCNKLCNLDGKLPNSVDIQGCNDDEICVLGKKGKMVTVKFTVDHEVNLLKQYIYGKWYTCFPYPSLNTMIANDYIYNEDGTKAIFPLVPKREYTFKRHFDLPSIARSISITVDLVFALKEANGSTLKNVFCYLTSIKTK